MTGVAPDVSAKRKSSKLCNSGLYRQTKAPSLPSSAAGSLVLCFDIDCDSGFEVYSEVILEDHDLRNQPHLLILDNAVDFSLFSHFPEPEDLVCDGIADEEAVKRVYSTY